MARSYRTSSNYTSNSYNAGISSSPQKTTPSNTGNSGRESGAATNRTQKVSTKAKAKVAKDIVKDNAKAFDNLKYTKPKFIPSILGNILSATGVPKKTFTVNKAYYEKNVIGKNNFTKSISSYKDYMSKRGSGKIDAMGRTISGGGEGGGNTQPGVTKNIGGSIIQTTQDKVQEASKTNELTENQKKIRNAKRGRSMMMMSGSQGVKKTSSDYSLGKKSLLGIV